MTLLDQRKARIGIIGLGYVGIPLALRFHEVGLPASWASISTTSASPRSTPARPRSSISSPGTSPRWSQGGFEATADFSRIPEVDAIIICVPTPLSRHREPDLSFIVKTMKAITPHLRAGQMVSLESTT